MKHNPQQIILQFLKSNKNFIMNNFYYIVCPVFYLFFSIALIPKYAFAILFLFIAMVLLCFMPFFETYILRSFAMIRTNLTMREKEQLEIPFTELFENLKDKIKISENVELCILDTITIQIKSLGRRTVAVSKGAIETLTIEQLSSLIACEFSHITLHHTTLRLIYQIASIIFIISIASIEIKLMLLLVALITFALICKFLKINLNLFFILAFITVFIFSFVFNAQLLIIVLICQFLIAMNSRVQEYLSDKQTLEIGYGEDLIETLYLLQKITLENQTSFFRKSMENHVRIPYRIIEIEKLKYGKI